MPVITSYASTHDTTRGTATFSNPTNVSAEDGVTSSGTISRRTTQHEFFLLSDFSASIPAGSTINSVMGEARYRTNSSGEGSSRFENYVGTSARVGVYSTGTRAAWPTALTTVSWSPALTSDDLRGTNGNLSFRVEFRPDDSNQTFQIDFLRLTVDYTPPAPLPKTATLIESFIDGSAFTSVSARTTFSNGYMRFGLPDTGYVSNEFIQKYDLVGSSLTFRGDGSGLTGNSSESSIVLTNSTSSGFRVVLGYNQSGKGLYQNWENNSIVGSAYPNIPATSLRRIVHDGTNVVYCYYSIDSGETWVLTGTFTLNWTPSDLIITIQAGHWDAAETLPLDDHAIYYGINTDLVSVPPSITWLGSGSTRPWLGSGADFFLG